MGYMNALGMAEATDLQPALHWHLTANHYPPLPTSMVEVCARAVALAVDDDWNAEVPLPEGVSYLGRNTAPVHAVVENHHLEAFVAAYQDGARSREVRVSSESGGT
jgi:hypothetical protein